MAKKKLGCGPLAAIIIIAFILLTVGTNEAVGFYFTNCADDDDLLDCILNEEEAAEEDEEGMVVATGVYTHKGYSVNITANIPLGGGAVTGSADGTCEASFKGTYSGGQNGAISGKMTGVCAPFLINFPASAEFTGTVNKTGKTVPFSFSGRGGGITHNGSMTLTYP